MLGCWLHATETIATAPNANTKGPALAELVAHLGGRSVLTIPRSLIRPGEVLRADDLVGFKLGYFVLGKAKQVPEDVLVVLAQAVGGMRMLRGVSENFHTTPG